MRCRRVRSAEVITSKQDSEGKKRRAELSYEVTSASGIRRDPIEKCLDQTVMSRVHDRGRPDASRLQAEPGKNNACRDYHRRETKQLIPLRRAGRTVGARQEAG